MQAYRSVLAIRDVRRVLLLILAVRIPMWAGNVVLTLHVVTHLHRSYAAAGLVDGLFTVAASISNPWRGRNLDRRGLRRTVAPCLVVGAVCWSIAPFVGYWPLLALASLAGLFMVPSFSIVRQALMHAAPDEQRRTALSVDSVMTEVTFMIGPPIGVLLATSWSTSWTLFSCEFVAVLGCGVLWLANPALRAPHDDSEPQRPKVGVRTWFTGEVVAVLVMSAAAILVLSGTGVAIVAALRSLHHAAWIGWELAIWGLGSGVGGLAYGALHRSLPVVGLLALLGGSTVPVGLAPGPLSLAVLLFVTGFFCAPTITAAVEALTRAVPEQVRGEALGWHGSAMTAGSAAGAPLAGVAIDSAGWGGGFMVVGLVGVVAAIGGAAATRRSTNGAAPAVDQPAEQLVTASLPDRGN